MGGPPEQQAAAVALPEAAEPIAEAVGRIERASDMVGAIERVGNASELNARQLMRAQDDRVRLHTVLQVWEQHQTQERELRKTYAKWLLIALFFQVGFITLAFFLAGLKIIDAPQWMVETYLIGTFGEIVGLAVIVVRYLFPKTGSEILDMIKQL